MQRKEEDPASRAARQQRWLDATAGDEAIFDVVNLPTQPVGRAIEPTDALDTGTNVTHNSGPMLDVGRSPVQRRASMSAIDAPRAESVSEDRATIGAAPAAAPNQQGAELDVSKADSLREDRATIAPESETAPGPLAPDRAAHAAAKNPRLVATHHISPADFGTDAAADSVAFAQAVAQLQAEHGLKVDGIAGPKTAAAVRASAGPAVANDGATVASNAPTSAADIDARGTGSSLVQMKAGPDAASEADVHSAAAAGVTGSGQPLPHREAIQKSFGAHDLTNVKAHVGGPAVTAAKEIGAVAYATGNDIAFAAQPDLHTAAHEAAHVVQQRSGVQLRGDVGQAGDTYEQQADAAADKVVRGESAEVILGETSSRTTEPAVQKEERGVSTAKEDHPLAEKGDHIKNAGDHLKGVLQAVDEGAQNAIRALRGENEVASSSYAPWYEWLLITAVNEVFGHLAGTVSKAILEGASGVTDSGPSGTARPLGVPAQRGSSGAFAARLPGVAAKVAGDSFKTAIGTHAAPSAPTLLDAFQEIHTTKLLAARTALTTRVNLDIVPLLRRLPETIVLLVEAAFARLAASAELKDQAKLRTMTEWVNFQARAHHSFQEGSETNVDPDRVAGQGLLDLKQGRHRQFQGIMEVGLDYRGNRGFAVHSVELRHVKEAAKFELRKYATVGEAPINKIIRVNEEYHLFDPVPKITILVLADGTIGRVKRDWYHLDIGRIVSVANQISMDQLK